MCIDIIDIFRLQTRFFDHFGNRNGKRLTLRIGRSNVISITSGTVTGNFTIDRRATRLRVFESLHD